MALALYRKYRPKTFEELAGQETNARILTNAAKSGKFGHAYLFYGPRGTGKTSTARLLAKLLNCEKRAKDEKFRAKGEPCNECRNCRDIDAQRSLDLIEIDAASNRGIDEIRNLKEGIAVAPSSSPYKVYIIDEVHMMTPAAFNALLKTLEEPPRHAVFILATTEYEKLPPTITSRAQRFLFKKIPKAAIAARLGGIAKAENIKISPEALDLVAASGEGSLRDAISLLDQLSASGEAITGPLVEELTGRTGLKKISELASLLVRGDVKSLAHLKTLADEGRNPVELAHDLIHYLRRVLTLKLNPALEARYREELTGDETAVMQAIAKDLDAKDAAVLLQSLIRAYREMRYSPLAAAPFEIAIAEYLDSKKRR